jgi:hypothetical protein
MAVNDWFSESFFRRALACYRTSWAVSCDSLEGKKRTHDAFRQMAHFCMNRCPIPFLEARCGYRRTRSQAATMAASHSSSGRWPDGPYLDREGASDNRTGSSGYQHLEGEHPEASGAEMSMSLRHSPSLSKVVSLSPRPFCESRKVD